MVPLSSGVRRSPFRFGSVGLLVALGSVAGLFGQSFPENLTRLASPLIPSSTQGSIMKTTHAYVKNSSDPEAQSLDLYRPSGPAPDAGRPMVLYIHGGGLVKGDKSNLKGHETAFPKAGYILAGMNYRKSDPRDPGKAMYPAHVEDVAAAIAWLHYNARQIGGDPNRIYLMGHSAGAALAALVATDERFLAKYRLSLDTLRGVVCNDGGFYDLMERARRPKSRQVIENAYGTDEAVWREASPSSHVRPGKNIPPFFLTFTTPPKEAMCESFARRLTAAGVPVKVFSCLGRGHEEVNFAVSRVGDPLHAAVFAFLAGEPSSAQSAVTPSAADQSATAPRRERKRSLAAIRSVLKGLADRI